MTTNGEWLDYLAQNAPDELAAWFDSEHTESPTSDTMRHIGQVIENTVKRGVYGDTAAFKRESDSREKIEAEALKLFLDYPRIDEKSAYFLTGCVAGFLDRQAAITEHEVLCHPDERDEQIAELQQQVDKLTAERERYRELFGKCLDYADAIHALMDEIDEGWS